MSSVAAAAAKTAFPLSRLVAWVSPATPTTPKDPDGRSPQTAIAADTGTLPMTAFDLEGVAVVTIGFVIAGGGTLLASRRLGKRRRNG